MEEETKETIVYKSMRDAGKNIGKMLEFFYKEFHKENPLEVYQSKQQVIEISKEYFSTIDEAKGREQLDGSLTSLFIKSKEKQPNKNENQSDENAIENEMKDYLEKFIVNTKKILKVAGISKEAEAIYATNICIPDDEQFKEDCNLDKSLKRLSQIYPVEQKYIFYKITEIAIQEKKKQEKEKQEQENNKKK